MASVTPGDLLEGYQLLGAGQLAPEPGIFIPLASLVGLAEADADEVSGDGRKVVFAIAKIALKQFVSLKAKPLGLTITKTIPAGVNPQTARQTYRFAFDFFLDFTDNSFDLVEG